MKLEKQKYSYFLGKEDNKFTKSNIISENELLTTAFLW